MIVCSTPWTRPSAEPRLHSERLAGYAGARAEVVLLAGWSMDREIWRRLLPGLRSRAHVTLLDLPGTGASAPGSWERRDILEAVLRVAPSRAIYVGWSLGGNIALALAEYAPQRVAGVLTLACNPCFVARKDWTEAMNPADFRQFQSLVGRRGAASLSRFDALQCSGADEHDALRWCRQWRSRRPRPDNLPESLHLLQELDVADGLTGLVQPVRHLLGGSDQLVPAALASRMAKIVPGHSVGVIAGRNHLLPLYAGDELLGDLQKLLAQLDLEPVHQDEGLRDKRDVARSFSRAASSYDSVAELQRRVGSALLEYLPASLQCSTLLDLGSGTGSFRSHLQSRYPGADYIGLDLAEGMARHARIHNASESARWLVADAEDLPLAAHSVDLVFSSLAIQWSEQLPLLFAEVERVLRPGGIFLFATLGPQTLHELRQSWKAVDAVAHVNEFLPRREVEKALEEAGLPHFEMHSGEIGLRYDRALDLLRELKALGAHNVNRGRSQGLTGRAQLQGMLRAYEEFRGPDGLPASYEVIYGIARKTSD